MSTESYEISFRDDGAEAPQGSEGVVTEETTEGGVEATGSEQDPERPSWLPEQFKTPEDLAKSYNELRAKLSAGGAKDKGETSLSLGSRGKEQDAPATQDGGEEQPAPIDFGALTKEYLENDGLTEDTLTSLQSAGISQDFIDAALRGVKATVADVRSKVTAVVGGEENLEPVLDWAKTNLTPAQQDYFDSAISSGNPDAAVLAMRGLYAQYTEANGREPNLVTGENRPVRSGVQPFASQEEYVEALQDPRYKTSPSFRREVDARLEASDY